MKNEELKMNNNVSLRKLGRSDLMVTPIGLGCWQFSKRKNMAGKFWPTLDDNLISQVVKASLEGGINWFDTAEVYGNGASEKALAGTLVSHGIRPGEVLIATKWWPMFRTASNIPKTIHARLDALKPFPIDLYQVHQPFGFSSEVSEMKAMARLVKEGKIRYTGVSNFPAKKLRNAWDTLREQGILLVSNQVRYSLLNRKIESNGILETAKELGTSIIAYSPLAQGILSGKFHDHPEMIRKITGYRKYMGAFKPAAMEKSRPLILLVQELAGKYDVTPSQVALNWLIHFHGEMVVAIPGATTETHASENTGAMTFNLSEEDMAALDKESNQFK
jgi:aryl-alcohol dehydrogenase-like predicted oxidoreductase